MNVPRLVVALLFAVSVPLVSFGDVEIGLNLDNASILQFERVKANVIIRNVSAFPLVFGKKNSKENTQLTFIIERDGYDVLPLTEELAASGVSVDPGQTREITVDLSSKYDLTEGGRYLISAVIQIGDNAFSSRKKMLDVVTGIKLMSKTGVVPGAPDKVREYTLRYWNRNEGSCLFLCADDPASKINYGVFSLGPLLRVKEPVLDVDNQSGIVVIVHQSQSGRYTRSVFRADKDRMMFVDQSYFFDENTKPEHTPMPTLKPSKEDEKDEKKGK